MTAPTITDKSLPDCMKLITQPSRTRTFWYESLNGFHFLCATSFNSTWVVKYELTIAIKDQFIFNVMVATLGWLSARLWVKMRHIHPMLGRPEQIQHDTKGHDRSETHPTVRRLCNASQNCRFPCIRSADDQCTESPTSLLEFIYIH